MNDKVTAVDTAPASMPAQEIPAVAPATPQKAEEPKVAAPAVKV